MNRCPITFEPCGRKKYSSSGLKLLSPRLSELKAFPYSSKEQLEQASQHATKMSIQGVQPKLSVKLNVAAGTFEIVDANGTFIVKPPHAIYAELVENEDVTMRMARASGIVVPLSGMLYAKDKSLSYFIKRFDRVGRARRLPVEDFAQVSEYSRDTKYDSSMEQVAHIVEKYCTFPVIEKLRLLRLTVFSFLVGNEDMHLKNFSLITREGIVELSPAYDLLNTSIVLKTKEELALPLMGKKSGLARRHFLDYFAIKRLNIEPELAHRELNRFATVIQRWKELLEMSFLSSKMQKEYLKLISKRREALNI